ncbi:type II toxin-antitoxin system RatA family toxin [Parvibium lacunae]|uniref:Type II toxin-antitoxin system RatA family toxin n=1 Tax=Parvibium lacunae TaxID=1888893 RepID=A0A368L7L3_9BURK|nr:type II toxin-antitoxin system RatA family toxin [Parvibium lacunae]RCS59655.1 type II toxin-antitoxin system RatA family toxin [Parvibium lacunae]
MAKIHKTVLVPYAAEKMFSLVEQVEHYPEFLPWCAGVDLIEREPLRQVATLKIAFKGIRQSFTTENRHDPPHTMSMQLREGPFRQLHGGWRFTPLTSDACKVEFELEYHFASSLLEKVIGPVFSMITSTFVDCFVKRAEQIYA